MCDVKMKKCSKCKEEKPSTSEYFQRDKNRKDGLYPQCKVCRSKSRNRGEVKVKLVAKEGFKICSRCNKEIPMDSDHFHMKLGKFNGLCKECCGYEFTNKLTKIAKENHKFCKKCDRHLPSTIQFFPPDKSCEYGVRNVCRECGKDGHFMEDDYIPKTWWTAEDEKLLADVYPYHLNKEIVELYFPNETEKSLSDKVCRLNIEKNLNIFKTEEHTKRRYELHSIKMSGENSPLYGLKRSEETRMKISLARKGKYVGENSPLYGIPKTEIHRKRLSVARTKMGLWKGDNNPRHLKPLNKELNGRWKGGVCELYQHLRRYIKPWKEDSMRNCNYKCVITGGEFDNVHHLFNFSYIMDETMRILDLPIHEQIGLYSKDELEIIEYVCLNIHYELGYGMCLKKDIHKLFHDNFGYSDNTPEQFNEFKDNYKNGMYDNLNIKGVS